MNFIAKRYRQEVEIQERRIRQQLSQVKSFSAQMGQLREEHEEAEKQLASEIVAGCELLGSAKHPVILSLGHVFPEDLLDVIMDYEIRVVCWKCNQFLPPSVCAKSKHVVFLESPFSVQKPSNIPIFGKKEEPNSLDMLMWEEWKRIVFGYKQINVRRIFKKWRFLDNNLKGHNTVIHVHRSFIQVISLQHRSVFEFREERARHFF